MFAYICMWIFILWLGREQTCCVFNIYAYMFVFVCLRECFTSRTSLLQLTTPNLCDNIFFCNIFLSGCSISLIAMNQTPALPARRLGRMPLQWSQKAISLLASLSQVINHYVGLYQWSSLLCCIIMSVIIDYKTHCYFYYAVIVV